MDLIDEQLEVMQAMVRAAGGHMGFDPDAPVEIKRAFLKILQECPDCRAELAKRRH